jgi:hypothetical protein
MTARKLVLDVVHVPLYGAVPAGALAGLEEHRNEIRRYAAYVPTSMRWDGQA